MTQGMETAAAIAQACRLRDDFRWLAGGLCPSDQTLLNLLGVGPAGLGVIWGQVLAAMHCAGHIDLSALVEDGTKLRANASPRSFHTAAEITEIVADLERRLAAKLQAVGEQAPQRRAECPRTRNGSRWRSLRPARRPGRGTPRETLRPGHDGLIIRP
jgi:hypothetical protein